MEHFSYTDWLSKIPFSYISDFGRYHPWLYSWGLRVPMCQLSPPSKGIPKVPPGQPLRPLKANQCLLLDLFWSSTEPTSILTNPFRDISRYIDIESWPQKRKHSPFINIIISLYYNLYYSFSFKHRSHAAFGRCQGDRGRQQFYGQGLVQRHGQDEMGVLGRATTTQSEPPSGRSRWGWWLNEAWKTC